jgi:alpha-N-arabinofuranosidase
VTTRSLGNAKIPNLPFENPDGTPLSIDSDYFGNKRDRINPFPGPFEISAGGAKEYKVWPK